MCLDLLLAINQSIDIYSHEHVIHIKNVYVRACVHLCVCGGGGSCMRAICVVCVCARLRETEYCGWAGRGEREFSLMCLFVTEFTNV